MKHSKRLVLCIVGVLLLGLVSWKMTEEWRLDKTQENAVALAQQEEGKYNAEQIVLEDTTKSRAEEIAEAIGAKLRTTTDGKYAVLYLPEGMTVETVYANKEYREYIGEMSLDYYAYASELEEDYVFPAVQNIFSYDDSLFWEQDYLSYVNLSDTWNYVNGSGVLVAVIDTGIDTDHVEFKNKISKKSYNASEDKVVADYGMSVIEDEQGHGTAVAGVIAASANNGNGIVGVAPGVELLVIKCECNEEGQFDSTSDLVFGLAYAIEQGADVVNMSFGSYSEENPYATYTRLAADSDVICVAAAGNDGSTQLSWPAADEYVIGVGAVDPNTMELTYYSNYGDNCDIVAPGTTMTTCMDGKYKIETGTSLAAPIVAGGIALRMSWNPYAEYSEIRELVEASGRDLGDLGADWHFGFGLFDVHALVCEPVGTLTYDMLTEEVENKTARFIQNHTLQSMEEPERGSAVFEGWYYDTNFTEEYHYFEEQLTEDITLYAKWINEDEGLPYTYVTLEDGTVEIRSYTGKRRYPTIPSTIEGKKVTSIGDFAFAENQRLRGITLPDSVTQIGLHAFENCSQLTSVKIPDQVEKIEESAFAGCIRLSSVIISEKSKLTVVEADAFKECGMLREFYIPKGVQIFPSSALFGTRGLRKITVADGNSAFVMKNDALYTKDGKTLVCYPAGITGSYTVADGTLTIDDNAFVYSMKEEILLPDSLTEIGATAFAGSRIKEMTIPKAVTGLGEQAFQMCFSLSKVTFASGSNIAKIPKSCFASCILLKEITVPDAVTSIGRTAFATSGIEKLTFGSGSKLASIDEFAFSECYGLTSVSFPKALKSIGGSAFYQSASLKKVSFQSGLESIGGQAFAKTALQAVELPAGVKNVEEGAFAYCPDLKKITVASGNTAYKAKDGVLLSKDGTVLHTYPAGKTGTSYTVASGVTQIGGYAFAGADKLTAISLPSTLRVIGKRGFSEARGLNQISLPSGLTEIGELAFEYCTSLYEITIPKNVVTLSRGAFLGAGNLWTIEFASGSKLSRLGNSCFAGTGINSITIPASVTTMGQDVFANCSMLYRVVFEKNSKLEILPAWSFRGSSVSELVFEEGAALKTIATQALENMTWMHTLDLSGCENLEEIGNFALRGCSNLGEITLPDSLLSIGRYAFAGCRMMGRLVIPKNVEFIGRNAFAQTGMQVLFAADTYPEYLQEDWDVGLGTYYIGVSDVVYGSEWDYAVLNNGTVGLLAYHGNKSSVTIDKVNGKKVSVLGAGLFAENTTLTKITLPETLTTIGKDAFKNTTNLSSVTIPASVTVISRGAFEGSGISSVTFASGSKLETIEQYAFAGTKSLKSISIPDAVAEIRSYAFFESALSEVEFGTSSKLATIGKSAFRKTGLTGLSLPKSLQEIGAYAFSETQSLKTLDLGSSTDLFIRDYAFYQSGMSKVTVSAGVSYIGEFAFGGCEKLTGFEVSADNKTYSAKDGILFDKEMKRLLCCPANKTGTYEIPSSVLSLAYGAFEQSKLTEVKMGNSNLMTIGYRAFYRSAIKKIQIPDSLVSIGYYAFADCGSLSEVSFGENSALNMVGAHAFRNCTALKKISLPKSVEDLEEYSFYGCTALKELKLAEDTIIKGIGSYALSYTGLTEFEIPETVEMIDAFAFAHMKMKEIVVPVSVKEIGLGAFEGCDNLTDITLPFVGRYDGATEYYERQFIHIFGNMQPAKVKNVTLLESCTFIGDQAFTMCETVEKITCLGRVERIGMEAFSWCSNLHYVSFREGLKVIERDAFWLTDLYEFKFPDSVEEIGYRAFGQALGWRNEWEREPMAAITLPKGLVTIGEQAFDQCRMTGVILPEGLVTIKDNAFKDCTKLEYINFPTTMTEYGNGVLIGCGELVIDVPKDHPLFYKQDGIVYNKACTEIFAVSADIAKDVVIPEGVTKIGQTFAGTAIRSITLPKTLTRIEDYAFQYCEKLESVTMSDKVTSIGFQSFYCCTALREIHLSESLKKIGAQAFHNCLALKEFVLPESLEEIGDYAIVCGATSIHVPKNVRTIGIAPFYWMHGLEEITVDEKNPYFKAVDGCLYTKDGKHLIKVPEAKRGTLAVPEGVTAIRQEAFRSSSLTEIKLPSTLKEIEQYAFVNSERLVKINIPKNITRINDGLFAGCVKLRDLMIEGELEELASSAFLSCESLIEKVDGVYYIGDYAIDADPDTIVLNVREGTVGIAADAFNGNNTDTLVEVNLPEGLQWVGDSAFAFNSGLRKVIFPDSLERLGPGVFSYCPSLIAVSYGNSITKFIHGGASGVEYAVIPDSVIEILNAHFDHARSLTIPNNLTVTNQSPYLETVILSETYTRLNYWQLDPSYSTIGNLVILSEEFYLEPNALEFVPDVEIYCMVDRKDNSWVETGIGEGHEIHYKNEWYFANFYADGITISSMPLSISDPVQIPSDEAVVKQNIGLTSFTFVGWDINGDGKADEIPALLTKDLNAVALFEANYCTGEHVYDYACDSLCNVCGYQREVTHKEKNRMDDFGHWTECSICHQELGARYPHTFDCACEEACNVCGMKTEVESRLLWESDETYHWAECPDCGKIVKQKTQHSFDSDCDAECNSCGYLRVAAEHKPFTVTTDADMHWTHCEWCGLWIEDQEPHKFDCACDTTCDGCGRVRTVKPEKVTKQNEEHHWTECADCGREIEAKKLHSFSSDCDAACNGCTYTREVPEHVYDCLCDVNCNVCNASRETSVKTNVQYNTDGHWENCETCGAMVGKAEKHTLASETVGDMITYSCGCGFSETKPVPTATPIPTATPVPTNTPVPTTAPTPTNVPAGTDVPADGDGGNPVILIVIVAAVLLVAGGVGVGVAFKKKQK